MNTKLLLAATLFATFSISASASNVGLILSLADGDIVPGTNAFRVSPQGGSQYIDGSGNLHVTMNTGSLDQAAYNAIYFDAVTLGIGESLIVNFTASLTNFAPNSDSSFRVGFFNSGGNQLTADVNVGSSATVNGYRGYSTFYKAAGTPSETARAFYKRTVNNDLLWNTVGGNPANTPLNSDPQKSLGLTSGQSFSGEFSITNVNGTDFNIASLVNGEAYHAIDSTGAFDVFDTLSFFSFKDATVVQSLTFTSLDVGVIPEPSTSVLLLGSFAALLIIGFRRRRVIPLAE